MRGVPSPEALDRGLAFRYHPCGSREYDLSPHHPSGKHDTMHIFAALLTQNIYKQSTIGLDNQIELVEECLAALAQVIKLDPSQSQQHAIKGIFVAPEYFLAAPTPGEYDGGQHTFRRRSVSEDEKNTALQRLSWTSGLYYPDILIVPGTIAWTKSFKRPGPPQANKPSRVAKSMLALQEANKINPQTGDYVRSNINEIRTLFWKSFGNDARVSGYKGKKLLIEKDEMVDLIDTVRGGQGAGLTWFKGVERKIDTHEFKAKKLWKDHVSNNPAITQLMRNTAPVFHDGDCLLKYHKHGDFFEAISDNDGLFIPGNGKKTCELNGLRFGFEICLDHNLGILQNALKNDVDKLVDIHIVCSAAVDNVTSNMMNRRGGFFLHASIYGNDSSVWKNNGGQQTKVAHLKGLQLGVNGLQVWRLNLSNEDVCLWKLLEEAVGEWEERHSTSFFSSKSTESRGVAGWIVAQAKNYEGQHGTVGLEKVVRWLLRRPDETKPLGVPPELAQLKTNSTLQRRIDYAWRQWKEATAEYLL
jgi:hypothetical protein